MMASVFARGTKENDISIQQDKKSCVTVEGVLCEFPFVYNGVTHVECTWADSPVPW